MANKYTTVSTWIHMETINVGQCPAWWSPCQT